MGKLPTLKGKQIQFVDRLLHGENAVDAYAAVYKKPNAKKAIEMLSDPKIQEYLEHIANASAILALLDIVNESGDVGKVRPTEKIGAAAELRKRQSSDEGVNVMGPAVNIHIEVDD